MNTSNLIMRWSLGRAAARRARLVVVLLIAVLATSCFVPRNPLPLAASSRPRQPIAILPIQPGDIRIIPSDGGQPETRAVLRDNTKNQLTAARTAGIVFDSLANSFESPLIAPSKVAAQAGPAECENLMVYLNDPGPLDESWKKAGLAAFAQRLGQERCLRVKLLVIYEAPRFDNPGTSDWKGAVTVQVEQLDLTGGQVMAHGSGEGKFWGSVGVIGGGGPGGGAALPWAIGTTFGRAVDQAARKALEQLFQKTNFTQLAK